MLMCPSASMSWWMLGVGSRARARARARVLLVDEGPPLAKVSPKPLDVPGSKINLGRHGYQIL